MLFEDMNFELDMTEVGGRIFFLFLHCSFVIHNTTTKLFMAPKLVRAQSMRLHRQMDTVISSRTHARTHTRTHARTHPNTHKHTHTHTHTHTHQIIYAFLVMGW